ncbi:MAG: aminotransferase class I/II-fold pyridoxal phosphate-dependent enzyme [Nitrospirae bacterium]|nr:aminotransferase class I/II-fold pyridoxal phosphate-dependent enzyme [Nitrospirota bacterium]
MFYNELKELRDNQTLRHLLDHLNGAEASKIMINGVQYINFASNDYLGLAGNAFISDALIKSAKKYGVGTGASRLLAGGTELHVELEDKVALFKGTEASLLFNSGYTANISAIPAIARDGDVILSDALNHASIIDGCRISKARKLIYRHRDVGHLSELLAELLAESLTESTAKPATKKDGRRYIIITDTVFSMDGDIAPLEDIYELCISINSRKKNRNPILLYLDDAHGTGVLGGGKGALDHFNIKPEPWIIQMGTFSKALGSFGAFIAGSRDVIDWLINRGRGFIFSTALPACIIAASLKALELLEKEKKLLNKLWRNRERLYKGIHEAGFITTDTETSIIPIIPPYPQKKRLNDIKAVLKLSEHLFRNNIYAPAIRPPTVNIPRIRLTITASHTYKDIDKLIELLSVF